MILSWNLAALTKHLFPNKKHTLSQVFSVLKWQPKVRIELLIRISRAKTVSKRDWFLMWKIGFQYFILCRCPLFQHWHLIYVLSSCSRSTISSFDLTEVNKVSVWNTVMPVTSTCQDPALLLVPREEWAKLPVTLPPGSLQSKGESWCMLDSSMYSAKKENTEKRTWRVGVEILEKMISASLRKWLFNKESENVNIMERKS